MLKVISKLIGILTSNQDPAAVAHGFACGLLLGFMPKDNALWYILFTLIFFMRIQRSTFAIALILASLFTAFLDPVFDAIGFAVLKADFLHDFFRTLLEIPFVAFTKINNTIVCGSLVFSTAGYVVFFWVALLFTRFWRKFIAPAMRKLKVAKLLKQVPLITKLAEMAQK